MKNYLYLEVIKVQKETTDSLTLTLKEKNNKSLDFTPGQFLTFIFEIDGREIKRGYSISSSPSELPLLKITIKKVSGGYTSKFLFESLKEGNTIKSLPPLGSFTVKPNKNNKNKYVFFGAGSGITPLYSMIKSILSVEKESKVYLLYGNRNEESIIYKNGFDELKRTYDNFFITYILSRPSVDWRKKTGRISYDLTVEFVKKHINGFDENTEFFMCGPEGMMKEIMKALKDLKVNREKIHREIYHVEIIDETEEVEEKEREVTLFLTTRNIKYYWNRGKVSLKWPWKTACSSVTAGHAGLSCFQASYNWLNKLLYPKKK
jgi:ring-1,2-phenylacetyl-CoA epoxidase subunit PaaE